MNLDMAPITHEMNLGGYTVDKTVIAHIKEASLLTGVDLKYLLAKAGQESSFTTNATSNQSTATGIYQFTESTWLQQFKLHGHKYGHAKLASKIERSWKGPLVVKDEKAKQIILNLRRDPRTSAMLAAEFAKSNQIVLEDALKSDVGPSDLYLAHFLGPRGAINLIKAMRENENQLAVKLFYDAAEANPKIFFKASRNEPRTVREVYNLINRIFEASISRFTNLPPSVLATLPRVLPVNEREPSIYGASMKPLVAPASKKANSLDELFFDEIAVSTAFNLDKYGTIKKNQPLQNNNDINLDAIFNDDIHNHQAKLPKHIAYRMLPAQNISVEDKDISLPEISFINNLIDNIDQEDNNKQQNINKNLYDGVVLSLSTLYGNPPPPLFTDDRQAIATIETPPDNTNIDALSYNVKTLTLLETDNYSPYWQTNSRDILAMVNLETDAPSKINNNKFNIAALSKFESDNQNNVTTALSSEHSNKNISNVSAKALIHNHILAKPNI